VVWKAELAEGPKEVSVGPGGTIYVLVHGRQPSLAALTPEGKVLWSWTSHREEAVASPAFDPDGNVHVLFGDRLLKVAANGRLLWSRRFFMRSSRSFGATCQPGFALGPDGGVYVAAEYLSAFAPDGRLGWQFRGTGPLSAPHVDTQGNIEATDGAKSYLVGASGSQLRAAPNPTSGEFAAQQGEVTYRLGWIGLETQRRGFNQLAAERQGAVLWEFTPGQGLRNVAPAGDVVYVGGEILAALDARSGKPRFRVKTNDVGACPTRAGVVAGCVTQGLVCSYAPDGQRRWSYGQRPNATSEPRMSAAAAPDGTVYVAGDGATLTALRDPVR
jgi:outer membrane protein assembly factor BamB